MSVKSKDEKDALINALSGQAPKEKGEFENLFSGSPHVYHSVCI